MQKNIKKRMAVWGVLIMVILTAPFLANAPWTWSDYIFAGVGLFVFALIYELVTRKMVHGIHRLGVGVAVLLAIGLVMGWAATGP